MDGPEAVSGLGEIAYSFRSPEGGFDNVWVFANGYRILVTDDNTTDIPGSRGDARGAG